MNKISVALCTYNGAKFLGEQLDSYLVQTRFPDELIVGDDRSTDATAQIIRDFARRAPFPVELQVNSQNLGSTENFARTISRCRGDIIFLSDQDDVWLPGKIEKMMSEIERSPNVGMVFSDAELVDENLESLGKNLCELTFAPRIRRVVERSSFFDFLLLRNYVTGATMAFRARFREQFAPFPTDIPEMIHDAWITFVVAANADFRFIDERLIKYRQHQNQQLGIIVETADAQLSRREHYAGDIKLARETKTRVGKILQQIEARPGLFARKNLIEMTAKREIKTLDEQIFHHETRTNLPHSRIKRLAPVAGELFSGRYHKISKGFLSAAKDLFGRL